VIRATLLLFLLMAGAATAAERPAFAPPADARVSPDLVLTDAAGEKIPFSSALGGKPAVMLIGYNKCPNLCGLTQNIVADTLDQTGLDEADYRALFVSVDPDETSADAAAGKEKLAGIVGHALPSWRFLVGSAGAVRSLTSSLGYSYEPRERIEQFVHPVSVAVLTPQGRPARLLSATTLSPRDLRLALVDASQGRIGSLVDHVLLFCSGFDTSKGQYTPLISRILAISGVATLALLAGGIAMLMRSTRA
jgi:protein SCO1/2